MPPGPGSSPRSGLRLLEPSGPVKTSTNTRTGGKKGNQAIYNRGLICALCKYIHSVATLIGTPVKSSHKKCSFTDMKMFTLIVTVRGVKSCVCY